MNDTVPILVADDDASAVARLEQAIAEVGFNNPFHVSPNGQEVLDYLKGNGSYSDRDRFPMAAMVIMELRLPIIDGFTILSWLRQHEECSVIPVLILSASSENEDVLNRP